jgi:transcriptional regulator with XRE-family HTH domain
VKNDKRVDIKDRLREALSIRNMKAVDLVEASGVPKSAISFYLAGKSKPKADRLYTIAQVLDVSEAWLLGYDVPMTRSLEAKKNDQLVTLVAKMRKDPDFFEVVSMLAALKPAEYESIKQLLSALGNK